MSEVSQIRRAYGPRLSYRALQAVGWGTLANLGYYPLAALPLLLGGLSWFQRRLGQKSIELLDPQPGDDVLDIGSGNGWSADRISRAGARVLGVDLLPEHVLKARRHYPGTTFAVADATRLPAELEGFELGAESFDRIHCLEAAFHFGAKGRLRFLETAAHLLRPGGRLVLVDFTWPNERPHEIDRYDPDRLVRDTWQFEEFEPLANYRRAAQELGLRELQILDWTAQVTKRFIAILDAATLLCLNPVTRFPLALVQPRLFRLWDEDWRSLRPLIGAHQRMQTVSAYTAFVFEKPAGR